MQLVKYFQNHSDCFELRWTIVKCFCYFVPPAIRVEIKMNGLNEFNLILHYLRTQHDSCHVFIVHHVKDVKIFKEFYSKPEGL